MKRKIFKICIVILCCFGIVGIFSSIDYGYKYYNKYLIKQNLHNQIAPSTSKITEFEKWSVIPKEVIPTGMHYMDRINGMLMYTTSLNNVQSQFLVSVHTLFTNGDHYTDLFFSMYYPQHNFDSGLNIPPVLYYQIDDGFPIDTKIRYWEMNDNTLYIHFRPNVYDFTKICLFAKTITFTMIDYNKIGEKNVFNETFSLKGFSNAHKFSVNQLKKIQDSYLTDSKS